MRKGVENLRLSEYQIKAIRDAVREVLGSSARIFIFGSRTDLSKKGGDIDIFVLYPQKLSEEEKVKAEIEIMKELYKRLGERKIDLIVSSSVESNIEKIAYETGVEI